MEPRANHLLSALPQRAYQQWAALLEEVDMPLGQVLYESGGELSDVYFPVTSIVALLYVLENGSTLRTTVDRCRYCPRVIKETLHLTPSPP